MDLQPIIRGVQAVGRAQILFKYLKRPAGATTGWEMPIPSQFTFGKLKGGNDKVITMPEAGLAVAGFRLDSEFVRANPQIASSFTIPLLGGGGVSLTNNNRTGTLTLMCTKVAVPALASDTAGEEAIKLAAGSGSTAGVREGADGTVGDFYDLVTLAQIQQSQEGGDSYGANITLGMSFSGIDTTLTFEMCTVASVDPIGIAGNDAVNYQVVYNYLNWTSEVKQG